MRKNRILVLAIMAYLALTSCIMWIKPENDFSESERRPLEQFPELSQAEIISGDFMSDFESYVTDQFPLRDGLRKLKTFFSIKILGQKDAHSFYMVDGYVSKMEYPLNEDHVERAAERFSYIYDCYLAESECKPYYAVIPDKNFYLAEQNGYLSMDYDRLFEIVRSGLESMSEVEIHDLLSVEDFYKTDIHWRQEKILDVSRRILQAMGNEANSDYEIQELDVPFYGVYAGQSGWSVAPDMILYYTNNILEKCVVYDYETNQIRQIYDMGKAYGRDPYEMFLSGAKSLLTIENPNAFGERELILFRDSFGSSIAPLLVCNYAKITLVDIRYIHPDMLEKYIDFEDQDVLFLYSTSVLNNGDTMK